MEIKKNRIIEVTTSFSFGAKRNNSFKTLESKATYKVDKNGILRKFDSGIDKKNNLDFKHPGHAAQLDGASIEDISSQERYKKFLFRKSFNDENYEDPYCEEARANIKDIKDVTKEIKVKGKQEIISGKKNNEDNLSLYEYVTKSRGMNNMKNLTSTEKNKAAEVLLFLSEKKEYKFNNIDLFKNKEIVLFSDNIIKKLNDAHIESKKGKKNFIIRTLSTDNYNDIINVRKIASQYDFFTTKLNKLDKNNAISVLSDMFDGYKNQSTKNKKAIYFNTLLHKTNKAYTTDEKKELIELFQKLDGEASIDNIKKQIGTYVYSNDPDRIALINKLVEKQEKKPNSYQDEMAKETLDSITKGTFPLMNEKKDPYYCADPFTHQAYRGMNQISLQNQNMQAGTDNIYFSNFDNIRNLRIKRDKEGNIKNVSVKYENKQLVKGRILFAGCDERGNREYKFAPKLKTVYPVKAFVPEINENVKKQPSIQGVKPFDHIQKTSSDDPQSMLTTESENYFRSIYSKTPYIPIINWKDNTTVNKIKGWIKENPEKLFQTFVNANQKLIEEVKANKTSHSLSTAKEDEKIYVNTEIEKHGRNR